MSEAQSWQAQPGTTPPWAIRRRRILRDSAAIGLAVGIYGLSFGAIAVAGGFSIWQTMALSLVMFTGGSQFAYIGVVAAGGSARLRPRWPRCCWAPATPSMGLP